MKHKTSALFLLGAPLLAIAACPSDPSDPEPCAAEGDPIVTPSSRDGVALANGDLLDVFPPPQGGVFTELDLAIENVGASEVLFLHVNVAPQAGGPELATVRYFGEALPLLCGDDDLQRIENLPVAFSDAVQLADIDGMPVTLSVRVETEAGEFGETYDLTLQRTDF